MGTSTGDLMGTSTGETFLYTDIFIRIYREYFTGQLNTWLFF